MEGGEGKGVLQPGRAGTPGGVEASLCLVVVLNMCKNRMNKSSLQKAFK